MDDSSAIQQMAEGVLLILGTIAPIPAGITAGIAAIAGASGWIWGTKHERKRAIRRADEDFINKVIEGKEIEENETT